MVALETSSLRQEQGASRTLSDGIHDFNLQCLRILRCTAKAMASSPGGLRFKAGTRPWLEGLVSVPALVANGGQRISAGMPTASD